MKIKLTVIIILMCLVSGAFLSAAKAENENKPHPTPSYTQIPIKGSWIETSLRDNGNVLVINAITTAHPPVVYMCNGNEYHMGYCSVYKEKDNTYKHPRYITDVVFTGTRCTDCISDSEYYTYREIFFREKIKTQRRTIKTLLIILSVPAGFAAAAVIFRKKYRLIIFLNRTHII